MKDVLCRVARGVAIGLCSGISCSLLGVDLSSGFTHIGIGQMALGGAVIGGSVVASTELVALAEKELLLGITKLEKREVEALV